MPVLSQQSAKNIAQEFVHALRVRGIRLKKAILFGSYVSNTQKEWSDIDLALVADDFTGVGYFDIQAFVDIKVSSPKFSPIETHTFPTAYFEAGDAFIDEIKRTGIPL